ncbi:sulfatase [Halorubrum halophilum]|uniref:sulfatase n=1 Tax=Halorubrum halophilum TaxID=413816 RepID=UPI00186AE520|nr:sulfatase [Halorubrum halophilum]
MKNVVLLTFDSLRADHCGYCGYQRNTTPNMDKLAEDGIAFTNAISPASRTNPSMAGIFTGEPLVTRESVADPEQSKYHLERHGTIAESLSEMGYATGAFCPNAYSSRYYGFDRGFGTFEDFLFSSERYQSIFDKHISDSNVYTTLRNLRNLIQKEEAFRTWDTYVDDMVEWANNQHDPYFLWGFSLDTHYPYITPRQFRNWSNAWKTYYYNWRCYQLLDKYDVEISDRDIQGITDIYDDSIRYADKLIGELRERLNEDTVFIVCADHGEALGERGFYGHFYPSLYEENIHVPLVIGGDINADRIEDSPISLTELPEVINCLIHGNDLKDLTQNSVVSTTFDGRRERNLVSVRTRDSKYHVSISKAGVKEGTYDLTERKVEPESTSEIESTQEVKYLAWRRINHEKEILNIRNIASTELNSSEDSAVEGI